MDEHAEQERVGGRADRLVQHELGRRVPRAELLLLLRSGRGLDEATLAGFAV